jgi:sugar phosphate isomerase/epimerase
MRLTLRTALIFALAGASFFAGSPAGANRIDSGGPNGSASMKEPFNGAIGLQLYSLRDQFEKDVKWTLDLISSMGIENVELAGTYGMAPEKFREMLAAKGLKLVSAHFAFESWRDRLDEVLRDAKTLGVEYVGCAWIPHQGAFGDKECAEAVEVFNRAGKAAAAQRLKFFYHTHGYEFQPRANGTLFDRLMAETKPEYVQFQMDVFWIVHAGQDPVKLFEKYGRRFSSMHLKDMKKGTPTGLLTGQSDVSNNVVLGTGVMDWPSILKAAKKAKVKWYFIEDESPSVVEQIPKTLRFLQDIEF